MMQPPPLMWLPSPKADSAGAESVDDVCDGKLSVNGVCDGMRSIADVCDGKRSVDDVCDGKLSVDDVCVDAISDATVRVVNPTKEGTHCHGTCA